MLAIGTLLRRREPTGDEWDRVVVRGVAEANEVVEYVVSPATFGEAITADPAALLEAYTLDTGDDFAAELDERLAALKEWATPIEEVTPSG